MERDIGKDIEARAAFIRNILKESGAKGVVYGNSGGKDCALVGILCRRATENVLGLILPCESRRNFEEDRRDAEEVAAKFGIATEVVDVTAIKRAFREALEPFALTPLAAANVNPRIRMTALYAVAATKGYLVAGTGNRSERYLGYYTKWGDGACDFNPISDLTVREVYEYLAYLDAPRAVRTKAPSAALFDGQTDEGEMGVSYAAVDRYLLEGEASESDLAVIERLHRAGGHKLRGAALYRPLEGE